ncbi:MAG: hypothetical protein KAR37_10435 [Alphaproteobacteria bacterium]|nr:hypothetical protein [Alphaproteobacteria bacterium]
MTAMKEAHDGSNLADFWANRGRRVLKRFGVYWYQVEGHFLQSLPYQRTVDPPSGALDDFLRAERATGARFPSDNRPGMPGGAYVFSDASYDIKSVHPKVRARVRRGLENFDFGPIESAMLLEQGLQLNRDTMQRQERFDPEFGEPARWRNLVKAIEASPGVTVYGAYAKDRLAAYMVTCLDDGWLQILHQMSSLAELPLHANHGLTFSITQQVCKSPDTEAVCYGLVPAQTNDGLHEYKLRMGYRVAEHNNIIHLHPLLSPLLCSRPALSTIHWARILRPRDQRLERLEHTVASASASRHAAANGISVR